MRSQAAVLSTTVPGLDTLLGGGLVPGTLGFVVGMPGAGKTVLASQIICEAVQSGKKAMILTAFSEGHVKLIEHLQPFSFFDENAVGDGLTMLSLQTVVGQDPELAATAIARVIRESGASVVLIDGFQGAIDIFDDPRVLRRTIAALATLLTYMQVVLLVTLEGHGRDPIVTPYLATADVVIGLSYRVEGQRHVRQAEIIKQRGRAPLAGTHSYEISPTGVRIYPRIEELPLPATRPFREQRARFSIPELDLVLNGGLTAGANVIAGAPGAGKTTLGLHWAVTAATVESTSLIVSFAERPDQLRSKAAAFKLDLDTKLAEGAVTLLRLDSFQIDPDRVARQVLDALTPATTRLVIDDIAGMLFVLGPRAIHFLAAFADHLYHMGITSLFLLEIEAFSGLRFDVATTPISLIADNVLIVQQAITDSVLYRVLAVLKMRYSIYDPTIRELVLDAEGVQVRTPAETARSVLDAAVKDGGFAPEDNNDSNVPSLVDPNH